MVLLLRHGGVLQTEEGELFSLPTSNIVIKS